MNNVDSIISQLEGQRSAIERAIAALRDISAPGPAVVKRGRTGRPPGPVSTPKKKKRRLSDEGRERIIEALRKRWAKKRTAQQAGVKRAAKKATKKRGKAAKKASVKVAPAEVSE